MPPVSGAAVVRPGACYAGAQEADVNLKIALAAQLVLEEKGHSVYLSRRADIDANGLEQTKLLINIKSHTYSFTHILYWKHKSIRH